MTKLGRWLVPATGAIVLGGLAVACGGGGTAGSGSSAAMAFTGGDFHSLVSDPADGERLFAGGHQAVSVSTDGGRSWREIDGLRNADAMGWGFAAHSIFVSGHPGVRRSDDGGRTFKSANTGLPNTDVHAFGAGGAVLYGASPGAGVFASTDGGQSWRVITDQIGEAFFGRILVDAADDQHLVAADARAGPVESRDGGRSWAVLGAPPATWVTGSADLADLIASGGPVAMRSRDAGRSWQPLQLPDGASLVEMRGDVLFAGVHDAPRVGVMTSHDGGATWQEFE